MTTTSYEPRSGPGRLARAGVICLVAYLLITALTPFGAAKSPDGFRYLDVALNIREGRGVVVAQEVAADDPGAPTPDGTHRAFTTYAPLYPAVLAPFVSAEEPVERGAARLAVLALFVSGLLLSELLVPVVGPTVGLLGTLLFLVAQPTLTVFTYAISEVVMVPMLLFSCWCCLRCLEAEDTDRNTAQAVFLALATTGLIGTAYTRYIGAIFGVLLPVTWLLSPDRRRWWRRYAVACAVTLGAMAAWYVRNAAVSGTISGARPESQRGVGTNIVDLALALLSQVGRTPAALGVALVAATAIAVLWLRTPSTPRPSPAARPARLVWLSAAAGGTYTVGLVMAASVTVIDRLDTRFVTPTFLFLLILLVVAGARAHQTPGRPMGAGVQLAAVVAVLALVAAQGAATFRTATAGWASGDGPMFILSGDDRYYNYTATPPRRLPTTIAGLEAALGDTTRGPYQIHRRLAQLYAARGDVASSLVHTRECLRLNRAQAQVDIVEISNEYFQQPTLYRSGIEYYDSLMRDLPAAWWVHANIATLAERLGDQELARSARARADALRAGELGTPR